MKSISICRTDTTVQRRTSIQVLPVCVLRETEQSGHLNVRTVLHHYVPNKGLRPLRCFAAILVDISCLTNTPLKLRVCFLCRHHAMGASPWAVRKALICEKGRLPKKPR